jgi:hypothetical protein
LVCFVVFWYVLFYCVIFLLKSDEDTNPDDKSQFAASSAVNKESRFENSPFSEDKENETSIWVAEIPIKKVVTKGK